MSITQANRFAAIKSSLPGDALLLRSCEISEQLGRPFRLEMELVSEDRELEFAQLLGQDITLELRDAAGAAVRYFNGIVSRFTQSGEATTDYVIYRATVVPKLWLLTRQADCRIFIAKSIPDILKLVLGAEMRGGTVQYQLKRTYPTLDFCVQYRETHFNFISRLMEAEGIYYFFKHSDGEHVMVVTDDINAHQAYPNYSDIRYHPAHGKEAFAEAVREFSWALEVQTGKYAVTDFDFEEPQKNLLAKTQVEFDADLAMFDYPGTHMKPALGADYARIRLEELQTQRVVAHGHGDALGICTGCKFNLTEHKYWGDASEWLVVGAEYHIQNHGILNEDSGSDAFSCSFTSIFSDGPYRPPRITPKPVIQGPQTAIVVGPPGSEIHTDKYGRVKVHFHWERGQHAIDASSFWIRVAQVWAGAKWGGIHIPRVGQEVIVEFLEGDPDRPIITGRVYNHDAMPPYDLPGNMTQSGIKSRSSKHGSPENFNEFMFEDLKGHEKIRIHAEKDQIIHVKHDCRETIGHCRHLSVNVDQIESVGQDRKETIKRDHFEEINRDHNIKITGTDTVDVTGDVTEKYKANHSEEVTSDYSLKAQNITLDGQQTITLKVGGTSITLDASGITLKTEGMVQVQGSGPVSIKSDAQVEVNAVQTSVQGSAMVTIKGGMVMIN